MSGTDQTAGHDRCGADKTAVRGGGTCGLPAGWGTDHPGIGRCRKHLGNTKNHQAAAARVRLTLAADVMGVPVDVDPHDGLLKMLAVAYGRELWLRDEVAELERHALTRPVGGGEHSEPRYEPNVLIRMHDDAIDRVARIGKVCHDAGIATERIELERAHGEQLAGIVRALVVGLGRRLDEPEVQELVTRLITSGGDVVDGTVAA